MRCAPLPKAHFLQQNNETPGTIRQHRRQSKGLPLFFYPKHNNQNFYSRNTRQKVRYIWNFSIVLSKYYRPLLLPLVRGLAFGALSISLRGTETTIRARMLMYDKVTQKNLDSSPLFLLINKMQRKLGKSIDKKTW